MAEVPQALLASLEAVPGFEREAFVAVHAAEQKITSVRVNPARLSLQQLTALLQRPGAAPVTGVPWSSQGIYLPQRPSFTFDPLFHAGCYYVQEASSMFLEQAMVQAADLSAPLKVLDLCAAPGGKSTHLQSLLNAESLLVSNEVIKARAGILRQNITKWGSANVIVTNNDPQHFARLAGFFDVVVVDAPCSGSGLFRRDPEAIKEWSEDAVQLCCGRQKRILADVLPALKEGGLLVYSTCSYSPEEDEAIADWLLQECDLEQVPLQVPEAWNVIAATSKEGAQGYRFFPNKVEGEGFYLACFRKQSGSSSRYRTVKPEKASVKEATAVKDWLSGDGWSVLKEGFLYALPALHMDAYATIKANLYVQQAGVRLGELMKDRLVPDHALALSAHLSPTVPFTEVSLEAAIRYLQRQDQELEPAIKGWQTIRYQGYRLGWINALPNRVNNYYPKEYRILKQWDGKSS